jgi:hypothetical protein
MLEVKRQIFYVSVEDSYTSRPTKGDVLMEKDILTVGSSTLIVGNGVPVILSAIVSPIWIVQSIQSCYKDKNKLKELNTR